VHLYELEPLHRLVHPVTLALGNVSRKWDAVRQEQLGADVPSAGSRRR
jgi:hypothetical protein